MQKGRERNLAVFQVQRVMKNSSSIQKTQRRINKIKTIWVKEAKIILWTAEVEIKIPIIIATATATTTTPIATMMMETEVIPTIKDRNLIYKVIYYFILH